MKILKSLFLLVMVALTACAQESNIKLSMKAPAGDKSEKYYVVVYNANGRTVDSVDVKNGMIEWKGNITQVVDAMIAPSDRQNGVRVPIILAPGEEAVIAAQVVGHRQVQEMTVNQYSVNVSGSKFYQEYDAADRYAEGIMTDYTTKSKDITDEAQRKEMGEKAIAKITEYAKQHASEEGIVSLVSYLGPAVLKKFITPSDRIKAYIDNVIKREEDAKKREEAENAKYIAMEGKPAPAFTLNDINGKPLSVSSIKGKYLILDFWGSWCIWCIRGIPKMKEYYEKYRDKLEILGIDCNDTEEKWKAAVKEHSLPWLHVYNPRSSSVLKDYNVQGFPTKVILDPQGNVVKVVVGEDPKFYTLLDEILK